MAVGAYQRIEICQSGPVFLSRHDHGRETLDIELMADTLSRRNDTNVLEGILGPLQEVITLAITGEFQLHIAIHATRATGFVGNDRMVDDKVAGNLRVDLRRVSAQVRAGFAHYREVDEYGNAGKVLEEDSCGTEFDFAARLASGARLYQPVCKLCCRLLIGSATQDILKQDGQRIGKLLGTGNGSDRIVRVLGIADLKLRGVLFVGHAFISFIDDDRSRCHASCLARCFATLASQDLFTHCLSQETERP